MELLNAAESSIKSKMDEASFKMNMCLNDPTQSNALEDFKQALEDFTLAKMEMQTIDLIQSQVQSQVQGLNKQNEAKTNPTSCATQ
jgi:hypothetical protein